MFDADTVKLFPLSNTLSGLMARPFVQNVGWWLNNDPTIPDNKGKKGGRRMTAPQRVLEIEELDKRLKALEELVLKQHDIIGVLIKVGQTMQKKLEEEE